MAFLMSDVAAGSRAVEQLQENVAKAPYIQDLTQAAATRKLAEDRAAPEEVQLKLEQDRIKALYAPQEAALKIEQEQAAIQQTKLANLVSQAKIDMTSEKKAAITKLTSDPEYAKLTPEDQSRKLAAAVMGIDTADGERLIKIADSEQAKALVNKLKEFEINRRQIGDGLATVRGATDQQFQGLLDKMPEDMKRAIRVHIPGFFEEKDPKLQKAQLEALMNNGEGKNNMAANEQRLKVLEIQLEKAQKSLEIAEQVYKNKQIKGAGGDAESKREDRQYGMFRRDAAKVDFEFKKPIQEATDAFKKAVTEESKPESYLYGLVKGDSATQAAKAAAAKGDTKKLEELKSTKAWRELQELKKEVVDRKLASLEGMPEGKEKDRLYEGLMHELENIDTTSYGPPEKTAPAKRDTSLAPKSSKPSTAASAPSVPSNKYTQDNPAKPTSKEEYDKLPPNSYYIQDGVTKRKKG
jgi:hypothetical protein